MTTLKMLAQQLTEPHLTNHNGRIGKVPALLSELREAVSGSSSGDVGGGSSSKQRILVNAQALDLLQLIDAEVKSAYSDRFGQGAPTLDTCIQLIAASDHPADWAAWLTELFQGFIARIEATLRPKKLRRLDNVACPSCDQSVHGEDRATCLYLDCYADEHKTLKHSSEWSVECAGCGATWGSGDMQWLLVALSGS